jgi:acyl-CoA synthetase (AMP-forming)/AMP-acid ligase II
MLLQLRNLKEGRGLSDDLLRATRGQGMSTETLISALEGGDEQLALLITEGGPEYTRKALRQEIFRTAAKFAALGIKRGDVVAMSFDNDVELIICFIAVCHLGATAAPLNAKYKPDEVVFYLTDISCNLLVVPASGNKDAEQAAASVNVPVATALVDPDTGGLKLASKTGGGEGEVNLSSLAENESIEETRAGPMDTALFLHTSGTTGLPKGVPLSHRNMVTTMKNIAATYKLTAADRGYVVMPLFHVHGLMCALFGALYSTGSIVLPGKSAGFQAHLLWGHVKQYACTWFTAVPTMHQSLLSAPKYYEDAGKPVLRFIRSCSSSLPPPVLYKMEEVFQAPVIEAYAMTEACHQMTSNPLPEVGMMRRLHSKCTYNFYLMYERHLFLFHA